MFWKKSSNKNSGDKDDNSKALVAQDPRTKVKTTSAATESTNTNVQNATIFNSNKNTVTFQSTRQTVTHTQQARITEIVTRRTPTEAELNELFRQANISKDNSGQTMTSGGAAASSATSRYRPTRPTDVVLRRTSFKRNSGSPLSPLALKFTLEDNPLFNNDGTSANRSSTIVKTEHTTVTQKNGRSVTQHVEEQRIKLKPNTSKWRTTTKTTTKTTPPTTSNTSDIVRIATKNNRIGYNLDARPYSNSTSTSTKSIWPPLGRAVPSTTTTSTYTSPYAKSSLSGGIYNSSSYPALQKCTTTITSSYPALKPSTTKVQSSILPSSSKSSISSNSSKGTNASDLKSPTALTALKSNSFGTITPTTNSIITSRTKSKLKPGYVYIFNNEKFDDPKNTERIGSQADVKQLRRIFENFKCKVTIIQNPTVKDIEKQVSKIEVKNFNENSSLVIVILSHGSRNDCIAAKDSSYSIDDTILFPILRNRTLNDKPKIFLVQACKGAMELRGLQKDSVQPHGSPNEVLKCYSTFEGYASYRSAEGSIFIQEFCNQLEISGNTKDIQDIMKDVRLAVKQKYQDSQIPSFTTSLTKSYVYGDYV